MHKTKIISKDFIRDCRIQRERERREDTVYQMPEEPSLLELPLPDCHSLFPQEAYSLDDFIHNLQADQFFYYSDGPEDEPLIEDHPRHHRPSIDHVNQLYLQRMAESSQGEEGGEEVVAKVTFCGEVRARYYRESEEPCALGQGQEFSEELLQESQRDMWNL